MSQSFALYIKDFLDQENLENTKSWLRSLSFHDGFSQSGKKIDRKQIWYHKEGHYFNPIWTQRFKRWQGTEYDDHLLMIQQLIQTKVIPLLQRDHQVTLNSCLVNYYQDGNAFIPQHKDNNLIFGDSPTIIGLSIGATRTFKVGTKEWELEDNSIFVMSGDAVEHGILCDLECHDPRYSLTFRNYIPVLSQQFSQNK